MDIQKEKIAHEKHLLSQGVDFKYLPNIQYNELENVYELIEWDEEYSEALNEINSSWCTWQAAIARMEVRINTLDEILLNQGEALAQAKAQAIPDGFVLMPIKPTETMVAAVAKEHEGDAFLPYSLYDAYVKQAMIEAQEPAND